MNLRELLADGITLVALSAKNPPPDQFGTESWGTTDGGRRKYVHVGSESTSMSIDAPSVVPQLSVPN